MSKASKTYSQRQAENIRSVTLHPEQVKRLDQFAEDNQMSRSEVLRLVMETWLSNKAPVNVVRRTQRVGFWCDPNLYMKFSRKMEDVNAKRRPGERRVTISQIIDETLEGEIL